jgi:hypothetical protein
MKMKKYLSGLLLALIAITSFSCKKVDVVAVEALLPAIQVSSLGMFTEAPYATTATVQLVFGATTSKKNIGVFDVFIYDAAAPTVVVETLHFATWNSFDSTTPNGATVGTLGAISVTPLPTTYPNTIAYQGSILLKLNKLTSGKSYTVKITGSTDDGFTSSYTVKSLFTIQ